MPFLWVIKADGFLSAFPDQPTSMAEKVAIMVLKVDLQCTRCYKKVKKVLCKFPQIRDQIYDEKHNTVTIKVVCCNPEKLRDKICCKGCGTIKSIEIKEPEKPKPPPKPADPPKPVTKPKDPPPPKPADPPPPKPADPPKPKADPPPKPVEKPKDPPPPKPTGPPPPKPADLPPPKPADPPQPKPVEKPKDPAPPKPASPPAPVPVQPEQIPVNMCVPVPGYPPAYPFGLCCRQCYEGYGGGPCYHGYGRPGPCYDGGAGRPIYDSYGGSRCDYYLSEENASGCSIM